MSCVAAWKLCGAALLPGAMLMAIAIILYALQLLDLFGLGLFVLAHIVVGWVYVAISPWFAPPSDSTSKRVNPFVPTPPVEKPPPDGQNG